MSAFDAVDGPSNWRASVMGSVADDPVNQDNPPGPQFDKAQPGNRGCGRMG